MLIQASNSNTVAALERSGVDAMFTFNLAVATSSVVMAWIIVVMAIKGWAVERRHRHD
jgi:Protein YTP1-like, C-terminal